MSRFCLLLVMALVAIVTTAEDGAAAATDQSGAYDPQASSSMEIMADQAALQSFMAARPRPVYVFTEGRSRSIRRTDAIPKQWLEAGDAQFERFLGSAQPGEYYVFQLGVYAPVAPVGPLALTFSPLAGSGAVLPASALHCFNLGGTDHVGLPFTTAVTVDKGHVQALWIGVDIPASARVGAYNGTITVSAPVVTIAVAITLTVSGAVLAEHGDDDSWRLSRLRWLDSTIGLDDDVLVAPYTAISRDGRSLSVLGRRIVLGSSGLPAALTSFFSPSNTAITTTATPILAKPMRLVVETGAGPLIFPEPELRFLHEQRGAVAWQARTSADGVTVVADGTLEQDGWLSWQARISSERALAVTDIRLELAYTPRASRYFMGLGRQGGRRPAPFEWRWDATMNQDSFWIGGVNAGMKVRFTGDNTRTALINAYYHFRELLPPTGWDNGGLGRIRLADASDGTVTVTASSGARSLAPGATLTFGIEAWVTPFKPLDTEGQWRTRYFHPAGDDAILRDMHAVKALGATVVNIHQGREANPFINYPYSDQSFPLLVNAVADAHRNQLMVNIYYTAREITNHFPELWAFKSLGGEIICHGPGRDARPVTNGNGPDPWLVEHLGPSFIPAWRQQLGGRLKGMLDLAVITTPDSRLENFYLEGLSYCVRHAGIDGLYIDDTSLGRKGFQRARRILDAHQPDSQITMHSWNHFNDYAGKVSSALVFMQDFPYFNRLWFGESFSCQHAEPDYWLVEMSGIPFGLMSEMLDGPNPWRGMVFGETTRLGWSGDPRALWRAWDEIGMAGSTMIGWWDPSCPVTTGDPGLLATVYRKPTGSVIALASWRDTSASAVLAVDWRSLALDPGQVTIHAPGIPGFQHEHDFRVGDPIPVEAGKGWLLVVGKRGSSH